MSYKTNTLDNPPAYDEVAYRLEPERTVAIERTSDGRSYNGDTGKIAPNSKDQEPASPCSSSSSHDEGSTATPFAVLEKPKGRWKAKFTRLRRRIRIPWKDLLRAVQVLLDLSLPVLEVLGDILVLIGEFSDCDC
jgi:hypothetical protein